jgi:hypothetical protein
MIDLSPRNVAKTWNLLLTMVLYAELARTSIERFEVCSAARDDAGYTKGQCRLTVAPYGCCSF